MACAARALEGFYRREKLPAGGHDGARIDWARAFGLPVPIVNTRARLEVLPYHDVHHLVTGYRTDEAGEAEVGAWCLGTGDGPVVGRVYDLGTFLLGLARWPRRTAAAFVRGRHGHNLYDVPAAELLATEEAVLRRRAGADRTAQAPTWRDRVALLVTTVEAAAWWLTPAAPMFMAATVAREVLTPWPAR